MKPWLAVAAGVFCIGWGGNQFTPMLIEYVHRAGYSRVDVDVLLGAYVLGLIPGLLVAAAMSNRYGRRPLMIAGPANNTPWRGRCTASAPVFTVNFSLKP